MTRLRRARPGFRVAPARVAPARVAPALVVAALALVLAACSDGLPTGAAAGTTALQLRAAVTGTTADAFAKTDAAHVHLMQGDAVLLDTIVSFSGSGGGEISLAVRLPNPSGTVSLTLELTSRGQALFQGSGSAVLRRGTTTPLEVTLAPIVTLTAPDSVTLTALGDTARLGGAAVFATGDTLTGSQVTWSGGGAAASVNSAGLAIALAEGVTQATATYQGMTHTTRITVAAVVTRIALSADTFSLVVGNTRTLSAAAYDRRSNLLTRTFTWQSSSSSVATVDNSGVVRGVGPGTATLTASTQGKSASATVTVRLVPVAAVQVTPGNASILPGATVQLTATTLDAAGGTLTGRAVAWTTSDPTVATVSGSGLVTGAAYGTATITATSEGVTGSASITVGQPIVGATPGTLGFSALFSGGAPAAQTVSVYNAGTGNLTGLTVAVSYPAGAPQGWITALSLSATTAPATLTVRVSQSGLDPGVTYSATIVIGSAVPGAGRVSIPVSFTVSQPILAVSTTAVMKAVYDTTTSMVQVTNAGSGTLSGLSISNVTYACVEGTTCPTGWLSASLGGTTAPTTLKLKLAPGTNQYVYPGLAATVTVTSTVPGAGNQQVTVTLQ